MIMTVDIFEKGLETIGETHGANAKWNITMIYEHIWQQCNSWLTRLRDVLLGERDVVSLLLDSVMNNGIVPVCYHTAIMDS